MITEAIKQIALSVLQDFTKNVNTFNVAERQMTPEELDEKRLSVIPQIREKINLFQSGGLSLEDFKSAIDGLNKRNRLWGFKGINGQMFFNMLTNSCDKNNLTNEFDTLLKNSIIIPDSKENALSKIEKLAEFTSNLALHFDDRRSAPKIGSIPFFISYFWQIQNPDEWPVYYSSMVNEFSDLGIWSPVREIKKDYSSFFDLNFELVQLFSEEIQKPINLWFVEHVFWYHSQIDQLRLNNDERQNQDQVQITTEPPISSLPESFIPPVVSIIPRLARNDESLINICNLQGQSIEKVFESRIATLFQMLGYEVEILGQGQGRVPDGIALSEEYRYAIIYDAKVRESGYTMGTDERAIREYINITGERLRRRGFHNLYFMVISSYYNSDHDEVIRRIKIDTDIREVLLVEASALIMLLEGKLRNPQLTLGPDGIQNLLAASGLITEGAVQEYIE